MTHSPSVRNARPALVAFVVALAFSIVSGIAGTASAAAGPTADLSSTNVNFGYVRTGTVVEQTVTLTNNGDAALTMTGMWSSSSWTALTSTGSSAPLPAGQSRTITFRYAPTARTNDSGMLTLNTNASGGGPAGRRQVNVSGAGAAPVLASPSYVYVGAATVGTTRSALLTIHNAGNFPLTVSAATIAGPDAAQFTVNATAALATPIQPGQTRDITVTFTPTATGAKNASLQLTSDASPAVTTLPIAASGS